MPGLCLLLQDQYLFCYTSTLEALETLRKSAPMVNHPAMVHSAVTFQQRECVQQPAGPTPGHSAPQPVGPTPGHSAPQPISTFSSNPISASAETTPSNPTPHSADTNPAATPIPTSADTTPADKPTSRYVPLSTYTSATDQSGILYKTPVVQSLMEGLTEEPNDSLPPAGSSPMQQSGPTDKPRRKPADTPRVQFNTGTPSSAYPSVADTSTENFSTGQTSDAMYTSLTDKCDLDHLAFTAPIARRQTPFHGRQQSSTYQSASDMGADGASTIYQSATEVGAEGVSTNEPTEEYLVTYVDQSEYETENGSASMKFQYDSLNDEERLASQTAGSDQ